MIENLLKTFEKVYKKEGDNIILDDYVLTNGIYILVNIAKNKVLTEFEVKKDEKCLDNKFYENIIRYDYYSKLIDMNKPIDTRKKVQSNQIYSFIIKSKNAEKSILEDSIEIYYNKLENYREQLKKDKIKLDLFEALSDEIKEIDKKDIDDIRLWIEDNIYGYFDSKEKTIKVFFVKSDLENLDEIEDSYKMFQNNMKKYLIPNMFVSTKSCIRDKEGKVLGVPNSWYTTNTDKPSFLNNSKGNVLPILLTVDETELRDKLRMYLLKERNKGNRFIYFNDFDIFASDKMIENDFYTNLIQINKDSNGKVIFEKINYLERNEFLVNIEEIVDFTENEKGKEDFFLGEANLEKTKELINKNIFNNRLDGYFYGDKVERDSLKPFTIKYKDGFYNWFFLGKTQEGDFISNLLLERFRIALYNGKDSKYKVKKIINLCFNLENCFNKIDYKGAKMELKERLKTNLETKEEWKIKDDKEFAFNLGQLLYYLNTKVKGKDRFTFEFLRGYFQIDVEDLKMVIDKISRSFMNKCYETLSNKSKWVLASLMTYLEEGEFRELKYNLLLLGATTNCLLFADTEKKEEAPDENNVDETLA